MAITDLGGGNVRKCLVQKWADFTGYGFNLHAEKGKAGQYIGKVDEGSPAEAAGLKEGDRIVEVNDVNIGNENHQQVVTRIKSEPSFVWLLVVDKDGDDYCKNNKIVITADIEEVKLIKCPDSRTADASSAHEDGSEASTAEVNEAPPVENDYETPAELPPVPSGTLASTHSTSDDEDEDLPPPPPELSELDDAVNSVSAEPPERKTSSPLPPDSVATEEKRAEATEKVEASDTQAVGEPSSSVKPATTAPASDASKASDETVPKMSAAEMREALAKNKRQDPRVSKKMSATDKLRMFQNL